MTSIVMRLAAVATTIVATAAVITIPVHAETCVHAMPAAARDVRGYTFEGTILSIRLGPIQEAGMPRTSDVKIAISRVHANPTDRPLEAPLSGGQTIEVHSNACDGFASVGVETGSHVLISTQSRYSASTWNTAVWLAEGAKLRLLVLTDSHSAQVWHTDDRRLRDAGTVSQALALVAPAAVGMPETATAPGPLANVGVPLPIVFGVVAFVLALLGTAPRWVRTPE